MFLVKKEKSQPNVNLSTLYLYGGKRERDTVLSGSFCLSTVDICGCHQWGGGVGGGGVTGEFIHKPGVFPLNQLFLEQAALEGVCWFPSLDICNVMSAPMEYRCHVLF